jgi:ParB-like chromosome segregation protein Spo0J
MASPGVPAQGETRTPYARNARTHSDAQVAQIAACIKEFGFVNPIIAGSDSVIIAGHGRRQSAAGSHSRR